MNKTSLLCLLLLLLAEHAIAEPDAAAQSADLAAKNMAYVSSALATFEKGLNTTASTRAAHILAVRNLGYAGNQVSINEVAVLQQTGGADLVKLYGALREHGDNAAKAYSQAAAADAAAKAEIAASYTPLKISTEKLDRAAKALATLAKEQTDAERAEFLVKFFKDTRDETKRLLEASEQAKTKADAQIGQKTAAATDKEPIKLKKE